LADIRTRHTLRHVFRRGSLAFHSVDIPCSSVSQTGFRETKMRNEGRVLFAVLNFYVQIKIRVAALDTEHSVTDRVQTVIRCFSPEAS